MAAEKSRYVHKKCEHGKQTYFCRECGGKGYCIHEKLKHNCIECSTSLCIHGKQLYYCKECGGKGYCIHETLKKDCVTCKGVMTCMHNKRKRTCIECNGTSICEHNTRKSICIICKGSSICKHSKIIHDCIICTPINGCQHCHNILIKHSRFKPYCFRCYCVLHPDVALPRQYKLKEHYVRDALKEEYKETITMIFDKPIQDGCSKYRPDIFMDFGTHCIVIEVDERRHVNYSCEEKRMITLYEDIGFRKIVFLRFNPDGYTVGIMVFRSPFGYTPTGLIKIDDTEMHRRITALMTRIEANRKEPVEEVTVEYLFYGDEKEKGYN